MCPGSPNSNICCLLRDSFQHRKSPTTTTDSTRFTRTKTDYSNGDYDKLLFVLLLMLASFLLLNKLLYLACHACILSETIDHTGHFEKVMDGSRTVIIQPPSSRNNTSRTNADKLYISPCDSNLVFSV